MNKTQWSLSGVKGRFKAEKPYEDNSDFLNDQKDIRFLSWHNTESHGTDFYIVDEVRGQEFCFPNSGQPYVQEYIPTDEGLEISAMEMRSIIFDNYNDADCQMFADVMLYLVEAVMSQLVEDIESDNKPEPEPSNCNHTGLDQAVEIILIHKLWEKIR